MTPFHKAAREYAERGIPVFPCIPGTKKPACEHGFHDATTDLAVIDGWWAKWPEANPAFSPHTAGLGVIDLDGRDGENSWLDLQIEYGQSPETYTVATPRNGRHLYYHGEVSATQSKIGPHIDTRGRGSYALLPPSRIEGWADPYRVVDGRTPADLPEWVHTAIGKARERAKAATDTLDTPQAVARARALLEGYVARGHVAIEGQMGDARTYAVACEVMNLGVSEETGLDLIDTIWNPHCLPPWDRDELSIKISNAASYAQNDAGAWATAPASEVFGPVLDSLGLKPEPVRRSKFYPMSEDEQDELADPTWLFPDLIPDESTIMLYGESGTYKSFVALDIALSLASGIEAFGAPARNPTDVVYIAGEGPRSISRARRPAWRLARAVTGPIPFHVIDTMPLLARPQETVELIEAIKAKGLHPKLVVIDTLARAMAGMNENDAQDAGSFVEQIETIKRTFGCAVLVIHHAGKETSRGARGSSALLAGFDAAFEVKADKRVRAVAVHARKMKDADEREEPWCFEGKTVGPSLVFFPVTKAEYQGLTADDKALGPKQIGAALVSLGATGEDNGVTTSVLAAHLTPPTETESAEGRQAAVERLARAIRGKAKDALSIYCTGEGNGLRWFIPAA